MQNPHADHPTPERLQAFIQGRLSDPESSDIEVHLLECQACCATLTQVSDSGDMFISRLCAAQASSQVASGVVGATG